MKYRVLKAVEEQGWEEGDIVSVIGNIKAEGVLEEVDESTPHKHFLAIVDPLSLTNKVNHG